MGYVDPRRRIGNRPPTALEDDLKAQRNNKKDNADAPIQVTTINAGGNTVRSLALDPKTSKPFYNLQATHLSSEEISNKRAQAEGEGAPEVKIIYGN